MAKEGYHDYIIEKIDIKEEIWKNCKNKNTY
jgi:hypothetical protein